MRQRWCIALRLPVQLRANNQKVVYDLAMMLKQYNKENENGLR